MQLTNIITSLEADLSEFSPERRLILSILIRALSDLEVPDKHIRLSAETWFNTPGNSFPVGFTYDDVKEMVDLDAAYTEGITKVLNKTKKIRLFNKRRRTNV